MAGLLGLPTAAQRAGPRVECSVGPSAAEMAGSWDLMKVAWSAVVMATTRVALKAESMAATRAGSKDEKMAVC